MDRVDWELVFIYLSVWLTVCVLLSLTSLSPHQSPFLFGNLIHCCCTLWSITQRSLSRGSVFFSLFIQFPLHSLFPSPFCLTLCFSFSFFMHALFLCVAPCLYPCAHFSLFLPPCPFLGHQMIFPAKTLYPSPFLFSPSFLSLLLLFLW